LAYILCTHCKEYYEGIYYTSPGIADNRIYGTGTIWQQGAEKIASLAAVHPQEWLLQYYTGWAYTQSSFRAPKGEAELSTEKAAPYVKKALDLQPGNTEILALAVCWADGW
jgi:hypothetical protein